MKCKVVDMEEIDYAGALLRQRDAVKSLQGGSGEEILFLLEHRPVITVGRNADSSAIIADRARLHAEGIEIHDTDRGGSVTYHGPGQLIGYPIIELELSRRDIGAYVRDLENVLIRTLSFFDIEGRRHPDNRGVWVADRKSRVRRRAHFPVGNFARICIERDNRSVQICSNPSLRHNRVQHDVNGERARRSSRDE